MAVQPFKIEISDAVRMGQERHLAIELWPH